VQHKTIHVSGIPAYPVPYNDVVLLIYVLLLV